MITYVTHRGYGATAAALDDRKLGRQRVEAQEIFNTLTLGEELPKDPVYRMWEGYEFALGIYCMMLCMEFTMHRGIADKIFWEVAAALKEMKRSDASFSMEHPPWHDDKDVMRSHRSNLLRLQNEGDAVAGHDYLKHFGKATPKNMPYLWPILDESQEDGYKLMVSKSDKALLAAGKRELPDAIAERVANL